MKKNALLLFALFIILSGCGRICIYDNPELAGRQTGIKFYTPKPYILVSKTGATDKPIEIKSIYLPDLNRPLYAKAYPGIGSSKLSMAFTEGMMTSFGQEADSKISDLITAIAGVPASLANADKLWAEASKTRRQASDLTASGKQIEAVAAELDNILKLPTLKTALDDSQIGVLSHIYNELFDIGSKMQKPGASEKEAEMISRAEGLLKNLQGMKSSSSNLSKPGQEIWNKINVISTKLQEIIMGMKTESKQVAAPSLTLYEIIIDSDGTKLKEVEVLPGGRNVQ